MSDASTELRRLSAQLQLPRRGVMRGFWDGLLGLAQEVGLIWIDLEGEQTWVFCVRGGDCIVAEVPRAKLALRSLCATIADWERENGAVAVNPYGCHCEITVTGSDGARFRMQVDFINTTRSQWVRVEAVRLPGPAAVV